MKWKRIYGYDLMLSASKAVTFVSLRDKQYCKSCNEASCSATPTPRLFRSH
ncbi:hypothetical protein CPAR01_11617 [Colletotrichum paranaense]|uniref:Uncharacterized protein n=3 Tax=Colletotrichum acutatum species complex TaxID=2707335 RepID=A0AAI9YT50_9PEZI|nr:uncharacterized protein CCOS01_10301 [Colletotrichum costaricense]XP_060346224.1 uncharacterized protein CPAR01_11617 [Colletotrichum paranaense]XP_060376679.1 uncharacterized protein CTAM01_12644 [Colletotrichum tamarilloi]KAI3541608.1 hypothetical protein CSPX01_07416 [Colletotrichum filicis]KAK1485156.1 hypothetical protein CTAM01_12644 [Colletotrichum tamarilloi]KAK1522589.1 hypothetical protein CCOS01_10301 [Colletotrichum costaricense]KAK1531968.1 hypothetical protein CPAR01_11617 [C